jgi:TatA/E family protein of Tat protein translocase
MGPIGFPEMLIILVVALIVFGPRKLPELGRSLGKSLGEFKRASNELRHTLDQEIRLEEQKDTAPAHGMGQPGGQAKPASGSSDTPAAGPPPSDAAPENLTSEAAPERLSADAARERVYRGQRS